MRLHEKECIALEEIHIINIAHSSFIFSKHFFYSCSIVKEPGPASIVLFPSTKKGKYQASAVLKPVQKGSSEG